MPMHGARTMPIVDVVKDSTATLLVITIVDENGNALDVSGGSSVLFHCSTIDGVSVRANGVGGYVTDGTNGQVKYQLTSTEVTTVRRMFAEFEVQGLTAGNLITETFLLNVRNRAKVS